MKCRVGSEVCTVQMWSVGCKVRSVRSGVQSVKCKVRSLKFGVRSVDGVSTLWSVECESEV